MKIKIVILLISLLAITGIAYVIQKHEYPKTKVTALIVDEAGIPINGVKLELFFCDARNNASLVKMEGLTDAEGKFTGEGYSGGDYGVRITKNGYYLSGLNAPKLTNIVNGQWMPWNPTCVTILRSIGKPVALYAKKVQTLLPVLDQPCGYDLEVGDWVAPYGQGVKQDFIFTLHQEKRGLQDYDVQGVLSFKNPLDGLRNVPAPIVMYSVFKWEREAPESGNVYQSKFALQNSWHGGKGITRSFKVKDGVWEGYFFRVRTVEQDGKIVSTNYGKIRGGIEIFPDNPRPDIVFTYYYNPTPNDRNLEWDTKKNLFNNLSFMETPREP